MTNLFSYLRHYFFNNFSLIFCTLFLAAVNGILVYAVVFNELQRFYALALLGIPYAIFILKRKWRFIIRLVGPYCSAIKKTTRLDLLFTWKIHKFNVITTASTLIVLLGFLAWLLLDAWDNSIRFRSLFGIIIVFVFGIFISSNPIKIKWRPVIGGFILQVSFAIFFLRWSDGYKSFDWLSKKAIKFLDFTSNGTDFVYGPASKPPDICGMSPIFVFKGLQILLYFGSIVSVLYYLGVIQAVLSAIASFMRVALSITPAESLNVAACVFLGTTEATLLIEPLLATMTESEIHTIMTAGFACISGSLFAIYVGFGACSAHLLSATVMSAAISISVSKLVYPEIEISTRKKIIFPKRAEKSIIECVSSGATQCVKFVWAIAANLLVYMSLLAFVNSIFAYAGGLVGIDGLSFDKLVGYLFFPIAHIIGVSDSDDPDVAFDETLKVAELLGLKTTLNEFIAYMKFSDMVRNSSLNGKRARMMATFALCGFTNIPMIGAQIGLLSTMCPTQHLTFAKLAARSFISALLSCLITTCVAGMIAHDPLKCPASFHENCLDLQQLNAMIISYRNTSIQ